MTWLILLGCFWVLAAAGVAMLPLHRQYIPGMVLMITAPVLIFLFGQQFGVVAALLALFAFVSMFRNPLRHFAKRAMARLSEPSQ